MRRVLSMARSLAMLGWLLCLGPVALAQPVTPIEPNIDRPGADLGPAVPAGAASDAACRQACDSNANCRAFTFVKPTGGQTSGQCFLKGAVPNPVVSSCCSSGAKPPNSTGLEPGVDRPGAGYRQAALAQGTAELCRQACAQDPACRAFTFVPAGVQDSQYHCYLKSSIPPPVNHAGMTSGVNFHPPGGVEAGVDRPGADLGPAVQAGAASAEACRQACTDTLACRAFTYVHSSMQCFLKNAVPDPSPSTCCSSGVKPLAPVSNENVDLSSANFQNLPLSASDPALCRTACDNQPACLAVTYVAPGGPGGGPRCALKYRVLTPSTGQYVNSYAKPVGPAGLQTDTNRPGADYQVFDLNVDQPEPCQQACANDPDCLAFAFARPGVEGPQARCHLKYEPPAASASFSYISGFGNPPSPTLEYGFARPGAVYAEVSLPSPRPRLCQEQCLASATCRAFTFLAPADAQSPALCQLKNGVPAKVASSGAISGYMAPGWRSAASFVNGARANAIVTELTSNSGQVLVTGGFNGGILTSTELYNPSQNTWTVGGSLNVPRFDAAITALADGGALVAGGTTPNSSWKLRSAERFNPATGQWSMTPAMSVERANHTATRLMDGRVLVAGGIRASGFVSQTVIALAEIYNPVTGTWSSTGSMRAARSSHTATLLPSGKVLVAGGSNGTPMASAELYDPATGSWTFVAAMPEERSHHVAVPLADGRVLVTGGLGGVGQSYATLASSVVFNPATGTWAPAASMNVPRAYANSRVLPSGKAVVSAGSSDVENQASLEIYDPLTDTWSMLPPLLTTRFVYAIAVLPGGALLAGGGWTTPGASVGLSSTEIYFPPVP